MKVPQINGNRPCPQIYMGSVDIKLRGDFMENLISVFRSRNRIENNLNQLRVYFSNFFDIPIFSQGNPTNSGWIINFSVIKINTFIPGTDDLLFSFIVSALCQPFVTIEGELQDSQTLEVLAKLKLTERKFQLSLIGGRTPSLPMIEIAAIKLLMRLKASASISTASQQTKCS